MLKRVITSVVGLPALVFLVLLGNAYLQVGLTALSLIGLYELYRAVSGKNLSVHAVGYAFCVIYIFSIERAVFNSFFMTSAVVMFTLMIFLVVNHKNINFIDCAVTLFGFYYVPFMLSNVFLVRDFEVYGIYFVWLIFISAWGTDTGAYCAGKTLGKSGKHKLTPVLSPKKTIEGACGGVIFSALLSFAYGLVVSRMFIINEINVILFCVVIGITGSVLAQFGDLTASAIKRYTGIKDYGHLFPGHGGVLDRFDSVLFTAPAVYLVMRALFIFPGFRQI